MHCKRESYLCQNKLLVLTCELFCFMHTSLHKTVKEEISIQAVSPFHITHEINQKLKIKTTVHARSLLMSNLL